MRRLLSFIALGCVAGGGAVGASLGVASLEPGLWSISRSATGHDPAKLCVRDFAVLAQWEHRGLACERTILSQNGTDRVIAYSCPGGDFGQSTITALTPRSLRVHTQGINRGEPFNYNLFARRTSNC
jgi:hypothetical protein